MLIVLQIVFLLIWPALVIFGWNTVVPAALPPLAATIPVTPKSYVGLLMLFAAVRALIATGARHVVVR